MCALLGLVTYVHVDRFAICILDCRVISFDEDSLDELRCSKTNQFDKSLQGRKNERKKERIEPRGMRHTGQSTFSHASRPEDCYVVLSVFGRWSDRIGLGNPHFRKMDAIST